MNYKEAKKHFKNEWKKTATDIDWLLYPKGSFDWTALNEWVIKEAVSDEGMPKLETVRFHVSNPNGLTNQLPNDVNDFSFIDANGAKRFASGCFYLSFRSENFHYKRLTKAFPKFNNFSMRDLNYHLEELKKDIAESWEFMANSKFNINGKQKAITKLKEINKIERGKI